MKFGKKEKQGLGIVGVLVYVLLFMQYNLNNAIPSISENREKNQKLQVELDKLEYDLNQIEGLKRTHKVLITANERYTDFIAKNGEIFNSMEYIEKLKRLFSGKIEGVKFDKPEAQKMTPVPYFYFTTTFSAKLTLEEINNLAQFIDGGTKKMKITKINISAPDDVKAQKIDAVNAGDESMSIHKKDVQLTVSISITTYSMELGSVEKMYEMSRNKFEEFVGYDGIVFDNHQEENMQDKNKVALQNKAPGERVTINLGEGEKPLPDDFKQQNIAVTIHSFFAGGSNFICVANKGENNQFANFKTKNRQNIIINLNDYIYALQTDNTEGENIQFSGEVPQRTRYLLVNANFPDIVENKELGADIKIVNNSQYNITVKVDGRKDRISIFDRNGNRVFGKGERDKIYML